MSICIIGLLRLVDKKDDNGSLFHGQNYLAKD